ncbi:MAG TPA: 2-oxoacid:acceptor oxidoreductase family protein [Phycisphaerales bacterium]|nr:2-oxoacid:acceptor oxidoreductase family protein [Phycisphaerales bacterium]
MTQQVIEPTYTDTLDYPYSGKRVMTDGNAIISRVAYKVNGGIAIYTITPSSPFGEESAKMHAKGEKNIYGVVPQCFMACDEAAAASFVQGMAAKGVGSATCSSSQGILLMIPEMYNAAGQLLPISFYIGARDLSRHSLTIFAGHSDVYAVRDTGIIIIFASNAQELQDLGAIAERLKWEVSLPIAVVYDGFLTTHRQTQVQELPDEFFWEFMPHEKMAEHKARSLDPAHPSVWGSNENPDGYMQAGLAQKPHTLEAANILPKLMQEFAELTGRQYTPYEYVGHSEATDVIVAAGSSVSTLRSTVKQMLRKDSNRKVGVVGVRAFRPFLIKEFIETLPSSVERIAVLDRSMTHTAQDEPLCADVRSAVMKAVHGFDGMELPNLPVVTGGIYGVAGKDFHSGSVMEVFAHLDSIAKTGKVWTNFTVGVIDDVMGTSLPALPILNIFEGLDLRQGRIVAYGSDGTVSMVKSAADIYSSQPNDSEHCDKLFVESHAEYDSKKAGGVTVSHFRVSKEKLDECFDVYTPDYVAVHHPALLEKRAGILDGIREGGTFVINTPLPPDEIFETLPNEMQHTIVEKNIELWIVDAFRIAHDQGLGKKISMIMQRVLFEKFGLITPDAADEAMETGIRKVFTSKGEEVVTKNIEAFHHAIESLVQVSIPDTSSVLETSEDETENGMVKCNICVPSPEKDGFRDRIQRLGLSGRGNEVTVGDYYRFARGGARPSDTWKGLARSFASQMPTYIPGNCTECGDCVFYCPTGDALQQVRLTPEQQQELEDLPLPQVFRNVGGYAVDASHHEFPSSKKIRSFNAYGIAVDPNLCTGCSVCAEACRKEAIVMAPRSGEYYGELEHNRELLDAGCELGGDINTQVDLTKKRHSNPEMEQLPNYVGASGACSGCYEPLYVSKFLQLYPYTVISNATGCSSIWGSQAYETPYSTDATGFGPAWVNPLFENNAAVGGGMALGVANENEQAEVSKQFVIDAITHDDNLTSNPVFAELRNQLFALKEIDRGQGTTLEGRFEQVERVKALELVLDAAVEHSDRLAIQLRTHLQMLRATISSHLDKQTLIVGGDGWAFDIGLQMMVHVLQSQLNVTVMVLVTDVYSNTGGQMSKATPKGMDAPFAPGGKESERFPLGLSVANANNAYVAQVNMAYPNHMIGAYKKAVDHDGPSLLLCYVPCMTAHKYLDSLVPDQARRATTTRYWPLWSYDPATEKWSIAGNPESKRSVAKFEGDFIQDFCKYEGRFRSQFDDADTPSHLLHEQVEENLRIWNILQKNAGVEPRD